ncbi:hypothetical protein Caci_3023 [Catenulispora acidiphila DSM 44928]|uniref:Uncharacterized protein n=1 Tax=Catenulispora acidiphila (strain DSM 44928 / JCM 14897 / NBRC 102108 / NRRL B-24433 / ID139908) TaxID=479433 RepID=C7Q4G3_CATAD|nr:hypothetical protein [Catenulispora acidiphila]ACU71932.1 hypothetical protein Caci_3023 [Catenulispora acidiphila DSM 44928]
MATRNITDLRRELVADSHDLCERSKAYLAAMKHSNSTSADFDAFEGLATAGVYAWTLAAVLRRFVEVHPESAEMLALVIGEVMSSGDDWLEDANDDLDVATGVAP